MFIKTCYACLSKRGGGEGRGEGGGGEEEERGKGGGGEKRGKRKKWAGLRGRTLLPLVGFPARRFVLHARLGVAERLPRRYLISFFSFEM